jgi:hypothetical protein
MQARRVVHDHIRKSSHWNPEESPHDVPHYIVALRLLRDYYKQARAEAEEEEAYVRQYMKEWKEMWVEANGEHVPRKSR